MFGWISESSDPSKQSFPVKGIESATSRVENLSPSQRNACLVSLGFNAVAKTTQFSNHLSGPPLRLCTTHSGGAFFITDSSVAISCSNLSICSSINFRSSSAIFKKMPIDRMQIATRAERIAQLRRCRLCTLNG